MGRSPNISLKSSKSAVASLKERVLKRCRLSRSPPAVIKEEEEEEEEEEGEEEEEEEEEEEKGEGAVPGSDSTDEHKSPVVLEKEGGVEGDRPNPAAPGALVEGYHCKVTHEECATTVQHRDFDHLVRWKMTDAFAAARSKDKYGEASHKGYPLPNHQPTVANTPRWTMLGDSRQQHKAGVNSKSPLQTLKRKFTKNRPKCRVEEEEKAGSKKPRRWRWGLLNSYLPSDNTYSRFRKTGHEIQCANMIANKVESIRDWVRHPENDVLYWIQDEDKDLPGYMFDSEAEGFLSLRLAQASEFSRREKKLLMSVRMRRCDEIEAGFEEREGRLGLYWDAEAKTYRRIVDLEK